MTEYKFVEYEVQSGSLKLDIIR